MMMKSEIVHDQSHTKTKFRGRETQKSWYIYTLLVLLLYQRIKSSCTVPKKVANSFGELGPKREVVLNGFKGPESDFGGSKIRKDS